MYMRRVKVGGTRVPAPPHVAGSARHLAAKLLFRPSKGQPFYFFRVPFTIFFLFVLVLQKASRIGVFCFLVTVDHEFVQIISTRLG